METTTSPWEQLRAQRSFTLRESGRPCGYSSRLEMERTALANPHHARTTSREPTPSLRPVAIDGDTVVAGAFTEEWTAESGPPDPDGVAAMSERFFSQR